MTKEPKTVPGDVKQYLHDLFEQGIKNKKKANPADVAGMLRKKYPFDTTKWLNEGQVTNQFSQISAKKKRGLDQLPMSTEEEMEEVQMLIEDEASRLEAVGEAENIEEMLHTANLADYGNSHDHPKMVLFAISSTLTKFSHTLFSDSACANL